MVDARQVGDVTIDRKNCVVRRGEMVFELPAKVFACVDLLAESPGELVSGAVLKEVLWPNVKVGDAAVRQIIAKARRTLREASRGGLDISARRGVGYVLCVGMEGSPLKVGMDGHEPGIGGARTPGKGFGLRPGRWPFVARRRELAFMVELLARVPSWEGGLLLVAGEAGLGKSVLVQEAKSQATRNGAMWCVGHCHGGAPVPPFWPWHELIQRAAADLEACDADHRESWFPVFEAAHRRSQSQLEWVHRISLGLVGAARSRPLCLVVEDLQWADEGSLRVLEVLSRAVHDAPLFIVATYRPEEVVHNTALSQFLARVAGRQGVHELMLRPLETFAMAELLAKLDRRGPRSNDSEELCRLTGGNPLMARLLLETNVLHSGQVQPAESPSLAHVVQARLSKLPTATRSVLSRASVLGHEIRQCILARVCGMPAASLAGPIEQAVASGLLRWNTLGPGRLSFAHDLVRGALYQSLPAEERRRLHSLALDAYQADVEARGEWEAQAWHAVLAGSEVCPVEAARLCERAGRRCLEQLAYDRAQTHLCHALSLREGSQPDPERAELLILSARAAWEAGGDEAAACELSRRALEEARATGDPRLLAEAAVLYAAGNDSPMAVALRSGAAAPEPMEDALGLLDGDQGKLKLRLARALTWTYAVRGQYERAARLAQTASDYQGAGDTSWDEALAVGVRCLDSVCRGEWDSAVECVHWLERASSAPGLSPIQSLEAQIQLALMALVVGESRAFRDSIRETSCLIDDIPGASLLGRAGDRYEIYRLLPHCGEVILATWRGDFRAVERGVRGLLEALERHRHAALAQPNLGIRIALPLLRYQGLANALPCDAFDGAPWDLTRLTVRAEVSLRRGQHVAASAAFDRLRELGFGIGAWGPAQPATLAQLVAVADLCWDLGDERDAVQLMQALKPSESLCVADGLLSSLGACARPLAELASQSGEFELAESLFEQASRRNLALGHRPECLRTHSGLLRLRKLQGRLHECEAFHSATYAEAVRLGMRPSRELLAALRD